MYNRQLRIFLDQFAFLDQHVYWSYVLRGVQRRIGREGERGGVGMGSEKEADGFGHAPPRSVSKAHSVPLRCLGFLSLCPFKLLSL